MRRARRQIVAAAWLGLATAAIAHGQAQPEPSRTGQTTTIVGCLVRGPSPTAEEFFVRTPAMVVPAGTPIVVGGSGAPTGERATTSAGTPAGTTAYRITGLTAAELKPHVGHRIELQGHLSQNTPPGTAATTSQDPKTGRATTSVKDDWTIAGVLHATTIKMVAATCQ
jgi:hypothetical protein